MSLKRRRWSNELLDSLVEFQVKENSKLMDSLEMDASKSTDSFDDCSLTSMIARLNVQMNPKDADNDNIERSKSSLDILNTSMTEDVTVCRKNSSTTPTRSDVNMSSTSLDANKQLFDFNERLSDNVTGSSGSETIKLSSCNSDNLNERIEMHTTSDSGTMKASSCNSSLQDSKEIKSTDHSACDKENNLNDENFKQRFFSSPVVVNKDADFISDIDQPDIWETLVALEQVLSPFEQQMQSSEEQCLDPPHILSRLSQKFKATPTRFTEKLVSIIEDSLVSSESPTKAADNSGISLHRMTGEFRKLCRFIEDESMPDWAPSLINITEVEHVQNPLEEKNHGNVTPKTVTNNNKNTINSPIFKFTPKGHRFFGTPPRDTNLNTQTPLRNFTPSADKSFEYWEEVCNMMYENQNSGKKKPVKRFSILKSVKSNMDDILSTCERQLASLDETGDIRCSEPCRKPANDLKPSKTTPRSKSTSKIFLNAKEKQQKTNIHKNEEKKISKQSNINSASELSNKMELSDRDDTLKHENHFIKSKQQTEEVIEIDNEIEEIDISNEEDDYVLSTNKIFRRNPDVSVEGCNASLYKSPTPPAQPGSYEFNDNDADNSLLIELAKRRQRCLDTAKLMMEIDREDPMTSNDDTKCVETLYKLGIQDKTFDDVQDDVKFINTLNHCFEYKKYLSDRSKPIINILSSIDSPEALKSRASSILRSKPTLCRTPSATSKFSSKKGVQGKPALETNRHLKSVHSRIATPRIAPTTLLKATPQLERKNSNLLKATPRLERKNSHSNLLKATPRLERKNSQSNLFKATPRLERKNSQTNLLKSTSQLERKNSQANLFKATNRSEKKNSQASSLQPVNKPRVSNRKLSPVELYTHKRTRNPSPTMNTQRRRLPSVEAIKSTAQSSRANLLAQPTNVGVVRKSSTKTTLRRETSRPTAEAKPQPSTNTKLRRTPSVEVPTSMSLRPGTANKPTPKASLSRQESASKLQSNKLIIQRAKSCEKTVPSITAANKKKYTPEQLKSTEKSALATPENVADVFSMLTPEDQKISQKKKLFVTPGKSPSVAVLGRKKPTTYFSNVVAKNIVPQKVTYDNVKSPIGMYVHSTEAELFQNIQGRMNDRLLTPTMNAPTGEGTPTPKLKFKLSSKENQSPTVNCDENMILKSTRYEPAKKICLTESKSPFTNANTPNSKTRKLLEPVENTVVIRHEGRVIQYNPNPNCSSAEMSIRVQKVADKVSSMKKKLV